MSIRAVLVLGVLFSSAITLAQRSIQRELKWAEPRTLVKDGRTVRDVERTSMPLTEVTYRDLPFVGAHVDRDRGGMPYFNESIELPHGTTGFSAHLTETGFDTASPADLEAWPVLNDLPGSP